MLKKLALCGALAFAFCSPAFADKTVKDASGTNFNLSTTTVGSAEVPNNMLKKVDGTTIDPATAQGQLVNTTAIQDSQATPGSIATAKATTTTNILPQLTTTARSNLFGATATQLMPANSTRHFIVVQNQSTTASCYIRGGGSTATADYNALLIGPGAYFESSTHVGTGVISIICTGASTPVYATEG